MVIKTIQIRDGENTLVRTIVEIVHQHPTGIRHVEIVRILLNKGFSLPNLSQSVHRIVSELVNSKVVNKKQDTREIQLCSC